MKLQRQGSPLLFQNLHRDSVTAHIQNSAPPRVCCIHMQTGLPYFRRQLLQLDTRALVVHFCVRYCPRWYFPCCCSLRCPWWRFGLGLFTLNATLTQMTWCARPWPLGDRFWFLPPLWDGDPLQLDGLPQTEKHKHTCQTEAPNPKPSTPT